MIRQRNRMIVMLLNIVLICFNSGCAAINKNSNNSNKNVIVSEEAKTASLELAKQGEAAYQSEELEKAKEFYRQSAALNGDIPMVHYRLGNIAFKQKDYVAAEKSFNEVIRLSPRQSKAYYNLAVIHLMKAEENFKYFTASSAEDKPVEPKVIKIISDIEGFASVQPAAQHEANPLERLAESLMVEDKYNQSKRPQ